VPQLQDQFIWSTQVPPGEHTSFGQYLTAVHAFVPVPVKPAPHLQEWSPSPSSHSPPLQAPAGQLSGLMHLPWPSST